MSFTESQVPLPDEVASADSGDGRGPLLDGPTLDGPGTTATGDGDEVAPAGASLRADGAEEQYLHPEDPDDDWAVQGSSRGVKVGLLTGALLLLVAVAGGFWGGAAVEKSHAASSSSSGSALSRLAAAARSAGGGTRTGTGSSGASLFGRGGFGAAAAGTVIGVSGHVLEISDSSGSIVKVTVGPTATVTRTSTSSLAGLKVGDTVTVTGSTAANGNVSATAVRASAPGVTTGLGGGGGSGGGFAGLGGSGG
jgi:hypothetical protein